jgi:hypothetical protein
MKKNYLILLALLLLQGSEKCEAGAFEARKMYEQALAAKSKNPEPSEEEKKQKEEKEKIEKEAKEKIEKEEKEKIEKEEKEKIEKEAKEKIEKEAKEKIEKEAKEAQEKIQKEAQEKIQKEEENKTEKAKSENDVMEAKLAQYASGTLTKEMSDRIAALTLEDFYSSKTIKQYIQKALNSEPSQKTTPNQFENALNLLGISNNAEGLNRIREQKARYEKELAKYLRANKDQETLVLESSNLALKRLSQAIQRVEDENFSVEVIRNELMDGSLPGEVRNLGLEIITTIDNLRKTHGTDDSIIRVQISRELHPLRVATNKAQEKLKKELNDANQNIEKEHNARTVILKLEQIIDYMHKDNSEKKSKINPSASKKEPKRQSVQTKGIQVDI